MKHLEIILNDKPAEIPEGSTVYDLVVQKNWRLVPMIIRVDGRRIPKKEYSSTVLREGQTVKMIPQFGGG